jgi:large subunit ribosomal protein L10
MPKELKRTMAGEVKADLDRSPNLLVIGLLPMDSATNLALRNTLRDQGAMLRVIHNRTSRHALDEGRKELGNLFTGQTALALAPDAEAEIIPVAKALVDAARRKKVEVRGGFVDGELLDRAGVEALARSPDKPTLRAMICGAILGPARGLAVTLQGVGGGIARCLQARIDKEQD